MTTGFRAIIQTLLWREIVALRNRIDSASTGAAQAGAFSGLFIVAVAVGVFSVLYLMFRAYGTSCAHPSFPPATALILTAATIIFTTSGNLSGNRSTRADFEDLLMFPVRPASLLWARLVQSALLSPAWLTCLPFYAATLPPLRAAGAGFMTALIVASGVLGFEFTARKLFSSRAVRSIGALGALAGLNLFLLPAWAYYRPEAASSALASLTWTNAVGAGVFFGKSIALPLTINLLVLTGFSTGLVWLIGTTGLSESEDRAQPPTSDAAGIVRREILLAWRNKRLLAQILFPLAGLTPFLLIPGIGRLALESPNLWGMVCFLTGVLVTGTVCPKLLEFEGRGGWQLQTYPVNPARMVLHRAAPWIVGATLVAESLCSLGVFARGPQARDMFALAWIAVILPTVGFVQTGLGMIRPELSETGQITPRRGFAALGILVGIGATIAMTFPAWLCAAAAGGVVCLAVGLLKLAILRGMGVCERDDPEPDQSSGSVVGRALNSFFSPGDVSAEIQRAPKFFSALAVLCIVSLSASLLIETRIQFTPKEIAIQIAESNLALRGKSVRDLDADERERMDKFAEFQAKLIAGKKYGRSLVEIPASVLGTSLLFFVFLLFFGKEVSFLRVAEGVCWAWMPTDTIRACLIFITGSLKNFELTDVAKNRLLASNLSYVIPPDLPFWAVKLAERCDVFSLWFLSLVALYLADFYPKKPKLYFLALTIISGLGLLLSGLFLDLAL